MPIPVGLAARGVGIAARAGGTRRITGGKGSCPANVMKGIGAAGLRNPTALRAASKRTLRLYG